MNPTLLRHLARIGGAIALIFALASLAAAQAPTTVQLPTFSFFTVNTTVSVPDSGGTYLGGLMRGFDSSRTRGVAPFPLLSSRGIASERSAGGMSVRAWIHDFRKMDEALLAEGARSGASDAATLKGVALSSSVNKTDEEAPLLSVTEIRRQNELADQAVVEEAKVFFAKAEEYEAAGKLGLAKLNYQRAASRESGELKQQALARIRSLAKRNQGGDK